MVPDYKVSVLTGGYDLHESNALAGIKLNEWSSTGLRKDIAPLQVWYSNKQQSIAKEILQCKDDVKPSVVYLNGMFSYRFVFMPLLKIRKAEIKIVLCPRGMLQPGALAGKLFKKKLYLAAIKLAGLVKNITWHATNAEEAEDIKRVFGNHAHVIVAPNIPKQPVAEIIPAKKTPGKLRLIYLSLIAEKKNLLQVIELINRSAIHIALDIYGPVKDEAYWKKCEQAIIKSKGKIKYMGDLQPEQVQETFSKYDASVLLTNGENFGHALYESLSSGRPIITSYFTPWNELEQKRAGWNLDISDTASCLQILEAICNMDTGSFNKYCTGAYEIAKSYYAESLDMSNYHKLFATSN